MWCSSGPASRFARPRGRAPRRRPRAPCPDRRRPADATRRGPCPRRPGDRRRTAAASRSRATVGRRQLDAVRHPARAVRVVAALAGAEVEQPAGDVGERQLVGVVVAQLVQAAAAAAVAERFPLGAGHLLERLGLPEWRWRIHGGGRLPGCPLSRQRPLCRGCRSPVAARYEHAISPEREPDTASAEEVHADHAIAEVAPRTQGGRRLGQYQIIAASWVVVGPISSVPKWSIVPASTPRQQRKSAGTDRSPGLRLSG